MGLQKLTAKVSRHRTCIELKVLGSRDPVLILPLKFMQALVQLSDCILQGSLHLPYEERDTVDLA